MALSTISNGGLDIGSQGFTQSSKITLDSSSHSVTGIPDGVREVHLLWNGLSTSAANPGVQIHVGTGSGLLTSGYNCQYAYIYDSSAVGRSATSSGIEFGNWGTGIVMYGYASLYRTNGTDDVWNFHYFTTLYTDYAGQLFGTGNIDLSAPLDRIAMVCVTTGTFDGGGAMQVLYR